LKYTNEQQYILDEVKKDSCSLLKVNSVAGSGKTSVLIGIAEVINPKNGIYLAYNKAISLEAKKKFPKNITCMTTHSLAYQNTISQFGLTVGFFNWKTITEKIKYEFKLIIIDIMNDFCLSKYTSYDDFVQQMDENVKKQYNFLNKRILELPKIYLTKMMKGEIDITHSAYLKMYHMMLSSKQIKHKKFGLIMLDECGDINPVTLEIFKLLPSDKKIMVGDENQNIYTFNNTINGFEVMRNEGVQLEMTKSFRCKPEIASKIELFCQKYLNENMMFKGTEPDDNIIRTVASISRTNSALVGEMIELIKRDEPFNLTRKSSSIFELLLILLNLKPGGIIYSKEWKFLQDDIDDWNMSTQLLMEFDTPLKFIASKYTEEPSIKTALGIIGKYGPKDIYMAYDYAKKHELEKGHPRTLCTAHSSKGLEFDKVIILDDMNNSIEEIIENRIRPSDYNSKQLEAMRLYYVACSRATKILDNAIWLDN
jgi:superfamily I DNA/RNA helicase